MLNIAESFAGATAVSTKDTSSYCSLVHPVKRRASNSEVNNIVFFFI
jgi:hypothetical protein